MPQVSDSGPVGRTDAELLGAHVAGDAEAFGELFGRHRERLWAVALRTTGNPEDAADGLQDAMVAAFRRAATFRGDSAVTTWLHRVVVNACLDRLRANAVRRAEPLPDEPEETPGGRLRGAGPQDPADAALQADRRARVLAALAALPPDQRAALVLVDMEGYPVAEAAEILDCAVGTVKSRCFRGRARLALALHDLLEDPEDRARPGAGNPPGPAAVPSADPARGPPARPEP